ncbi:MAG TPA: tyrosine-protein phosphatase [Dehalococcoidia bacterium]|nr:tyrosine-protein phosphatase [Dehalococcoidia bacterium]
MSNFAPKRPLAASPAPQRHNAGSRRPAAAPPIAQPPAALSDLHAEALAAPGTPLRLEGMFNLRDLGGYATDGGRRTRSGRIFRADSLAYLSDADQIAIARLGLGLVCDLRSEQEIARYPDRLPPGVRHVHNPMRVNVNVMGDDRSPGFDWGAFRLEQMFIHMLEHSGETFRRVFAHLAAEESYPYLFHCAAGKDRTGVTAALLLRTAGVPDEAIIADFALSDGYIAPKLPEFRARSRARGVDIDRAEPLFRAPAAAMQAVLSYLDERHGSTAGYLRGIGVPRAEIAAFRAQFVEATA